MNRQQQKAMFAKKGKLTLKQLKPLKKMNNKQYNKIMKKAGPYVDSDGDGIINKFDCKPFDKKKQDEMEDAYQDRADDEARDARPGSGVSHEQAESDFFNVFKNKKRR